MIKKKYKLRAVTTAVREFTIEAPNEEIARAYAEERAMDITLLDEWQLDVKDVIFDDKFIEKTDQPADIEMDEQWLDTNYECSYTQRDSKAKLKVVA
jgi:hypothetical protein